MIHRVCSAAAILYVLAAPPAAAQTVEVLLREDSTRAPIAGAIVRLLREQASVAQALTSEAGRASLRAPAAGTFRIRIDRIGFSGMLTEPFTLSRAETIRREIAVASIPSTLPTLVVRSERSCTTRLQEGALGAALWEEIRKALTAAVITQRDWSRPLHVREFEREVSPRRDILREWTVASRMVRGAPYGALSPDTLAQVGFVVHEPGQARFAAPDAALLLSDQFVETHCFRAVRGRGESVGLAFEPVRKRRVSDVLGTLWVDRRTSELQFLEYTYTNLPPELQFPHVGGRVEFRRLPNGAFIVSYWHIRMPRTEVEFNRAFTLSGYLDQGGRVDIEPGTPTSSGRAMLSGRVVDSTTGSPLAGSVIRVRGWPDSVLTDGEGGFQLAIPGAGRRTVTASHPKLGLIPDASSRDVVLSIGETTVADFAVPPVQAFVREFCGSTGNRSGVVGLTIGTGGSPVEGLEVRVRWEPSPGSSREERTRSGPRGVFALCDLPAGKLLPVRLQDGRQGLSEHTVKLAPGEFKWMELMPR